MPKYFEDYIPSSGALLVEIESYGEFKRSKNGKKYAVVHFLIGSKGNPNREVVSASIFENTITYEFAGALPEVGTMLEVSKNDKGFLKYKVVNNDNPPVSNNSTQVRTERAVTASIKEERNSDDVRQIMISLAGLTQAFIIQGKSHEEAISLAVTARELLVKTAKEVHEHETAKVIFAN